MPPEQTDVEQTDDRRPPPNGAGDDGEDQQSEAASLKAQLGKVLNEKKKIQAELKEAAEQAKRWSDIERHANPDQVKSLLAKLEDEDLQKARESGEIDKLLKNQKDKHDREKAELEERIAQKERLIEAITVDRRLQEGLEKIKVRPGLMKACFAYHRPRVKAIADPESPHGIREVVEIGGEYMGVDDYLRHWAESDPDAVEFLVGNQSSGGGALGGRGALGLKPRSKMTPAEKSQYIRAHGKAAYDKLPWEQSRAQA
jgi:hypothetical protein